MCRSTKDKVVIDQSIIAFNEHSKDSGRVYYKAVMIDEVLYEAKDLVNRRSYNNHTVQLLLDGTMVETNKFYNDDIRG